jgi:hypothetical protein
MRHGYGDRHTDDLQFSLAKMRQQLALGSQSAPSAAPRRQTFLGRAPSQQHRGLAHAALFKSDDYLGDRLSCLVVVRSEPELS